MDLTSFYFIFYVCNYSEDFISLIFQILSNTSVKRDFQFRLPKNLLICFNVYFLTTCSEFLKHIIKLYGLSLHYGNKYIYQSMPRLLTHWLDFGQAAHKVISGWLIVVL